jgi:hypothetical protein
MASDWEKLAADWEGHDVGLVAEVDCTAEGEPLCSAEGVRGFPTIKYGDPTALEDYDGGRGYEELSTFAKENLKPVCSPKNLDLCDADTKKLIEEYMAKSEDDLVKAIETEEKKIEQAEETFMNEVQKLQEAYEKLNADKEKTIADVKASGLGLMKAVKSFKAKKEAKDEL